MTEHNGGLPPDSGPGLHPSDDERMLEELRSILIGRHQQELVAVRERLDNQRLRAQDVSEVVTEALRLRESSDKNGQLSQVLLPTVERALTESVRNDAMAMAEVLYPVMGPAIRKSIYESIRALIQSFDEALTQGLSIRGLKWRFEAMRTRRPFAEVVLLHTLLFRVEQVFLIHKKTGLLLHHLASPQLMIQDPDIVSGMLSAIRDFVRHSFDAEPGASLDTMQVGDLQVWVEQGPRAILASVIRGQAPQRLRFRMKELLEEVHQKFGGELDSFQGDDSPFLPAAEILRNCLESQLGDEKPFRPRPFVPVLAALVVLLGLVWGTFSIVRAGKWNRFVDRLRSEPGVVVTSYYKRGGRFYIQGLRDPLSIDPAERALKAGLDPGQAVFEWKGYESPEDPLVLQRTVVLLKPPEGVVVSIRNGTLIAKGECDDDWASRVRIFGPLISGVRGLDTAGLRNLGPFGKEKAGLESQIIFFSSGHEEIPEDQGARVEEAAEAVLNLLAKVREVRYPAVVEIAGHTDSTGTKITNSRLSRRRAQNVLRALVKLGIPANSLRLRKVPASKPLRKEITESDRRYNRSVTFRVVSSDFTPKR